MSLLLLFQSPPSTPPIVDSLLISTVLFRAAIEMQSCVAQPAIDLTTLQIVNQLLLNMNVESELTIDAATAQPEISIGQTNVEPELTMNSEIHPQSEE